MIPLATEGLNAAMSKPRASGDDPASPTSDRWSFA